MYRGQDLESHYGVVSHRNEQVDLSPNQDIVNSDFQALERILYVWAIRHPASGYVQGINDLVCPFFQVFLSAYIGEFLIFSVIKPRAEVTADTDPELFDVAHLPKTALAAIEADTFWCLSKLLDGIQDNYISHQPGIQRLVQRMRDLVKRIDGETFLFDGIRGESS